MASLGGKLTLRDQVAGPRQVSVQFGRLQTRFVEPANAWRRDGASERNSTASHGVKSEDLHASKLRRRGDLKCTPIKSNLQMQRPFPGY